MKVAQAGNELVTRTGADTCPLESQLLQHLSLPQMQSVQGGRGSPDWHPVDWNTYLYYGYYQSTWDQFK